MQTNICVYPSAIARAIASVDESPAFHAMPDGYIRVLIRLIKKINLNHLCAPINASRKTISRESGKSIETVGRVVKWLEEQELVTRKQKHRADFRGSSAPLTPTTKLLVVLMLKQSPAPKEEYVVDECSQLVDKPASTGSYPQNIKGPHVSADASISTHKDQQSLQRQPKTMGSPEKMVKVGKFSIPGDLVWLVQEQNLAPTALFSLMKQAKEVDQRLSDVVSVTKTYLVKLSGRPLYAYLSTLVRQNKDYRYISAQQMDSQRMRRDFKIAEQNVCRKAIDLVGRRFQTMDGRGTIDVEHGGWLKIGRPNISGSRMVWTTRPLDTEFLRLVDGEQLKILA